MEDMAHIYICPRCSHAHSVEEYRESRFCSECGTYLPAKSRVSRAEYDGRVKKTEGGAEGVFPYVPYEQQLEFVKDIQRAVGNGGILVAEACNGFGKTVCALSALLPLGRRIIYATRTHEQVRQVLEEMGRINSKARAEHSAVNLASRHQLCLDERCGSLPASEGLEACRVLREEGRCRYRSDLKDYVPSLPPVLSIVDLRRHGRALRTCPYFLARRLAETSRVVVAPYQYVFDPAIRERVGLQLEGKILVFDEAHNADAIGLEVLSDTLSDRALSQAMKELDALERPAEFLEALKSYLEENVGSDKAAKPSKDLYEDLRRVLGGRSISSLVDSHSKFVDKIRTEKMKRGDPPICYLAGVLKFLSLVDCSPKESYVALCRKTASGLNLIEYRCLDPSLAIGPVLEEVQGSLIMSGTLAPIELYTEVLGIPKAETRTYSAIAKPENVQLLVDSSVTTRFSERGEAMTMRYGKRIAGIVASIPNGVLVFFPQKGLMLDALEKWRRIGIVEGRFDSSFLGEKRLYVEGEDASENRRIVEEYKRVAEHEGAVLCCVFRGRNAEGSNFPDEQARGVILVGVPYADISDPTVRARIDYLNQKQKGLGERWYVMDAFKAANQAIGRGIRHREDWCNFMLMDQRYKSHLKMLSSWALAGRVNEIPP